MHTLYQVSLGLALLVAASSLAAAGHVPISHERAGEANRLMGKRQAAPSCTDALCVFSEALATFPSSVLPKPTPPPSGSDTRLANIQVSVAQPSLCSESVLQFSSSYAVPTGGIRIATETEGWGVEGSIWNISANDGVQLNDFRVPCQGSACTGIAGNREEDGSIVKNADGSW